MTKIALAIPTYNAGTDFEEVLNRVKKQSKLLSLVKIYDSESEDNTISITKKVGFDYQVVKKDNFSHSGTRTMICKDMYDLGMDFIIFLTQDVFLQKDAVSELVNFIIHANRSVAMAYGKQIVDLDIGNHFEFFARSFNYGDKNLIKSSYDIPKLGIKTIFCSDAFSIYDLRKASEIGFFGNDSNFSEDMIIADKFIQRGYSIGYCASAKVFHTHKYSIYEEFVRYKTIGAFYRNNQSMISKYGKTNSEGVKLAMREVLYLIKIGKFYLIPESIIRNSAKFVGHKVGFFFGGSSNG